MRTTVHHRRALARLATLASALALLAAAPARGDVPVHAQSKPTRADTRGGLLLLSFLVPLPLPLALVAPPSSSRPPVATAATAPAAPPTRQAAAPSTPARSLAKRATD